MSNQALFAALALALFLGLAWLIAAYAERRRRGLQSRLAAVLAAPIPIDNRPAGGVSLRRTGPIGIAHGLRLLPQGFYDFLIDELGATGERLSLTQLVIAAVVGTLSMAVLLAGVLRWPGLIAVPLSLAAGIGAATVWLRAAQNRFQRHFLDLFPEALDVIVRAVRAGLPVIEAMEAAVGTVPDPVAGEFRRLLDELRIGIEIDDALQHAANRIRISDFRFFAATLVLQRRTGGSLAGTLTNLAGLIRRRKEIRLKAGALSAESRATAYLLAALPVLVGSAAYVIRPEVMSLLFADHRGRIILGLAIFMLVTGILLMRAMIKRAGR